MQELLLGLVETGASVATPLGLGGFVSALTFGVFYRLLNRLPVERMRSVHVLRVIQRLLLLATILGVTALTIAGAVYALDRWWASGYRTVDGYSRARKALEQEDLSAAKAILDPIAQRCPHECPEVHNLLGEYYYLSDDFRSAAEHFRKAYTIGGSPGYLFNIAAALAQQREFSQALGELERVRRHYEESGQSFSPRDKLFRSFLLGQTGRCETAEGEVVSVAKSSFARVDLRPLAHFHLGLLKLVSQEGCEFDVARAVGHFRATACLSRQFDGVFQGTTDLLEGDRVERLNVEKEIIDLVREMPIYQGFLRELGTLGGDASECARLVEQSLTTAHDKT